MKRIGFSFILLAAICLLAGCGSKEAVEITEEQNNMIAEYMAGALLRYNMRYEEELIYTSAIEDTAPEESKSPAPEPTASAPATQTPAQAPEQGGTAQGSEPEVTYSSLDEVIGEDGIELAYKSSSFYDSYPKGDTSFVIEPNGSNQLLVAEFQLSNASSKDKTVDLSGAGIQYALTIGGKEHKALLTALPNDLRFLSMKLKAGKKKTVIVVFEVGKDATLGDASLTLTRGSQTAKVNPL